ncbi:MAG TPA: glycosyltransferase [Acidimicrobiales bacterium]|nr:glycosyltransferase [Acidimicrobiales bacterium]
MRALVISSAWAPEHFPHRLVRRLLHEGCDVTVAAVGDRGKGALADLQVDRLVQPEGDQLRPATAVRIAAGVARNGLACLADQRRLVDRLPPGQSRSAQLKTWYTLMPFLGRRWGAVHVPAEVGTAPYLALFGLAGPAVVNLERPLPRPGSGRDRDEGATLRAILGAAVRVECASEALVENALAFGAEPAIVKIVPDFVDRSFFTPAPEGRRAGPPRLVCTPPFHWRAGHDELLVALASLVRAGIEVHLDLVADGADQQRLFFTVQDLGLGSCVSIHRELTQEEARGLLHGADVFVLPSTEDRIWPEMLEAIAVGLPVVACDVTSTRAALAGRDDRVLVPPHDPATLARALGQLSAVTNP